MKRFSFDLEAKYDSVITVKAFVGKPPTLLALDTAASQTVLDLNLLLMSGYSLTDLGESVDIETANGFMQVRKVSLKMLNALGLTRTDFEVLTYDFLEKGLLGLDFFENTVLTIDFQKGFIVLKP
jgi:predicted aspartyl protease